MFFIMLILINISIISSEEFGYNLIKKDTLKNLNDVTITNPASQQVIIYNASSSRWYNSYLNDSSHSVNASDYWITNIGALSGVNNSQFSNEGGLLTSVKSWWDGFYCELTGCTMTGDLMVDAGLIIYNMPDPALTIQRDDSTIERGHTIGKVWFSGGDIDLGSGELGA